MISVVPIGGRDWGRHSPLTFRCNSSNWIRDAPNVQVMLYSQEIFLQFSRDLPQNSFEKLFKIELQNTIFRGKSRPRVRDLFVLQEISGKGKKTHQQFSKCNQLFFLFKVPIKLCNRTSSMFFFCGFFTPLNYFIPENTHLR